MLPLIRMLELFCPRCKILMKLTNDFNIKHFVCLKCQTNVVINNDRIFYLKVFINEYIIFSYPEEDYISVHYNDGDFTIDSFLIDFENESKFFDYIKCYHLLV